MDCCHRAPVDAAVEHFAALPASEQVSQGQAVLQMLGMQRPRTGSRESASMRFAESPEVQVLVRRTFIEVVAPCRRARNRSMSDSALLDFASENEQPWQKVTCDKVEELSDASTTISLEQEAEEVEGSFCGGALRKEPCWSDDEGAMFMPVQPYLPFQYVEPCCMPVGFDSRFAIMCSGVPFGSAMLDASGMPMQWADQSMGAVDCSGAGANTAQQEWRTTVMLRNMPNNYTRDMLLKLVDSMGFANSYDFAYLPVDFKSWAGLGYAFINFTSTAEATRCFDVFEGFSDWTVPSEKVCTVTWGSPYQGLEAHIERYQNSPVMHPSIADEWKPILIRRGMRIPFPAPTKPIKVPKTRQHPSTNHCSS